MKHAVANLLLNLAMSLGAEKGEDRRLKIADGNNKLSSILNSPSSLHVEALLTASPVWGVDEAKATAAFLNSPAGQLFSKRIRSVAAHVAIDGAKDRVQTIHSAGVSAGWNECVRYIHSLATCQRAILRVSGDQDTGRVGLSDSNDGQQPNGEAALVERLSP